MYKSILVPLDGSKRAERILPHVEELALRFGAEVIFIRVVEPLVSTIGTHDSSPGIYIDVVDELYKETKAYLTALKGEFREKGISVKTIVGRGTIVNNIISVSESENVDLIAMASHGRTGLGRVFYGSVAAGVLHQVDRPLLLIRARSDS